MPLTTLRRILLAASLFVNFSILFLVSLDVRDAGADVRDLDRPEVPVDLIARLDAAAPRAPTADGALIAELQEAQAKQERADRAARQRKLSRRGDVEFRLVHTDEGDVWIPHIVESIGVGKGDFGGY